MIEITNVDLKKFVQEVYALSQPAGLGFLHFKSGGLSEEDAKALIDDTSRIAVNMDYVRGRGCKMIVHRKPDGRLEINDRWFDHTPEQLCELLTRCGVATDDE